LTLSFLLTGGRSGRMKDRIKKERGTTEHKIKNYHFQSVYLLTYKKCLQLRL